MNSCCLPGYLSRFMNRIEKWPDFPHPNNCMHGRVLSNIMQTSLKFTLYTYVYLYIWCAIPIALSRVYSLTASSRPRLAVTKILFSKMPKIIPKPSLTTNFLSNTHLFIIIHGTTMYTMMMMMRRLPSQRRRRPRSRI